MKEIRVPKNFGSIAGFTALAKNTVNIADAYDEAALKKIHPSLKFDPRWDQAAGFRTTQLLSTPILFDKYIMGVLQAINKSGARDGDPTYTRILRLGACRRRSRTAG